MNNLQKGFARVIFILIMVGILAIGILGYIVLKKKHIPDGPIQYPFSFTQKLSSPNCEIWHDKIEEAFINDNYCNTDSDCQAIPLGGRLVEFGCIHYLNKNITTSSVYATLNVYAKQCTNKIDKCAFNLDTVCRASKCITKPQEKTSSQADLKYEQYTRYKSHKTSEQLLPFELCYVQCAQKSFQEFVICVKESMCDQID